MKTVKLNEIFDIEYGNQLDFNKLNKDREGINFISRSKTNLGISCKVEEIESIKPYKDGLITVTLGGSYLLSAFVQPKPFYTAQNIKVLTPKQEMDFKLKAFYCYCISSNRFRYSSHGREANKTLDFIPVPTIKDSNMFIKDIKVPDAPLSKPKINKKLELRTDLWTYFQIDSLFNIEKGKEYNLQEIEEEGPIPVISATENNNGNIRKLKSVDIKKMFKGNCLTVMSNAIPGRTFYQEFSFAATSDINVCIPKFRMNKYIGMFLVKIFNLEHYRFSYGRKLGRDRLMKLKIKLPIDKNGTPDWEFMEKYIKSLSYSSNL